MMNYKRVIPRDLFNEAKLLKCIGRLCLLIEDGFAGNLIYEYDREPFSIWLDENNMLCINNIDFELKHSNKLLFFSTVYNSKDNYPLYCETGEDEYLVFEENGEFTEEFKQLIK